MAMEYIDNCVGCSDLGLPCLGKGCPNHAHWYYVCEKCREPLDDYGRCPYCDYEEEEEDKENDT